MEFTKTFTPRNGAEWQNWLAANHDKEHEIWVVYFKTSSGQTGIDYETSVEEALCFGWIDSIIQKIDAENMRISSTCAGWAVFGQHQIRGAWQS